MKYVNLGCGNDYREKFINIDIREEVEPDIVADIRDIPLADDTVDMVVMQDILEHFADWEVVLREAKRILAPGRRIFIRVPNWERISKPEFWKKREFYRCENKVLGGRKNEYDVHKSLWTERISEKRMAEVGFKNITTIVFDDPPLHWHLGIRAIKSR